MKGSSSGPGGQAQSRDVLNSPVRYVKHVGPATSASLQKLGIETIGDLLHHFPPEAGYLNRTSIRSIASIRIGETVSVAGVVKDVQKRGARFRKTSVLTVGIYDGSGYVHGVWFNQDYLARAFRLGAKVIFSGRAVFEYGKVQMKNPTYDIVADGESPNSALGANRILPLHPTTQTLSRAKLRRIMRTAVDAFSDVPDPIPAAVRKRYGFVPKGQALRDIHFPQSTEACGAARERLIFEELFLLQTGLALRKKRVGTSVRGIAHKRTGTVARAFYDRLPFSLTQDQKAAISAIARDMDAPHPMSRLVQGEVASGKTVVAVFALLMAVDSGYQGAIMAPTEVLAEQHFLRFSAFLRDLPVKIALLSGGLTGKDKEKTQQAIACGAVDIVVGTQALIQDKVTFKKLGLAVVDEQHRFGVRQRARLKQKTRQSSRRNDWEPDILIMTATPIPRTLSLTLYGDLDVSVIKELPCGRSLEERVETVVWSTARRDAAYARVEEQVARGRQAYIICPLIEESDNVEAKAVLDEAARLKDEVFPNLRVDFIHSRMGTPSKEKIMAAFREHRLDILISTTVVEVGVDVPNATVMVVENAERFGLSQLHQLRGRVGRGKYQSLFVLLSDRATEGAKGRLDAVRDIADGFKLAEKDMELRGEGELLGARQSGLPDLKLAKLSRDMDTLIGAREEAFSLVERDPELKQADHVRLLREVRNRFAGSLDWIFHT